MKTKHEILKILIEKEISNYYLVNVAGQRQRALRPEVHATPFLRAETRATHLSEVRDKQ